jgi:hypothetical protein
MPFQNCLFSKRRVLVQVPKDKNHVLNSKCGRERKGREGVGREGRGREWKGRELKGSRGKEEKGNILWGQLGQFVY